MFTVKTDLNLTPERAQQCFEVGLKVMDIMSEFMPVIDAEKAELLAKLHEKNEMLLKIKTDENAKLRVKGAEGERTVFEELIKYFPHYQIEEKTRAHAGDIWVTASRCKIMIEVKNYSKNVPTTEIVKFQNDMAEFDAAILIALNNGIVGQTSLCQASTFNGKPYFTLARMTPDNICIPSCIEFLIACHEPHKPKIDDVKINMAIEKIATLSEVEQTIRRAYEYNKKNLSSALEAVKEARVTLLELLN